MIKQLVHIQSTPAGMVGSISKVPSSCQHAFTQHPLYGTVIPPFSHTTEHRETLGHVLLANPLPPRPPPRSSSSALQKQQLILILPLKRKPMARQILLRQLNTKVRHRHTRRAALALTLALLLAPVTLAAAPRRAASPVSGHGGQPRLAGAEVRPLLRRGARAKRPPRVALDGCYDFCPVDFSLAVGVEGDVLPEGVELGGEGGMLAGATGLD